MVNKFNNNTQLQFQFKLVDKNFYHVTKLNNIEICFKTNQYVFVYEY